MKISVAIATYNGDRFLKEQLESIVKQSVKVDEIVIIDDCSTDNTLSIVECFEIKYSSVFDIIIYKNDINKGVVNTFKRSIELTTGDIIFLSDQDDIWHKDKVLECTSIFEKMDNVSLICSGYNIIDRNGEKTSKNIYPLNESKFISFDTIIKGNKFPGCTMVFESDIKTYLTDMNGYIYIHDWYIGIISSMKKRIYYLNRPLIGYRIHDSNTIGKNTKLKARFTKEKRLESIQKNILFYKHIVDIITKYNSKKDADIFIKAIHRCIELNEKRFEYLNNRKGIKLFIYSVLNINKLNNIRDVIGDLYYVYKD